jgi:sodium-dependent dicarboxylate transporter 2/3/5
MFMYMKGPDSDSQRLFSKGKLTGLILGTTLFIVFAFNLPGLHVSAAAAATAGIVLMMACFWVSLCLPIPVTSLLPIILFPLFGVAGSKETVKYYADNNIYLFMGGFIIALAIEKWGLHKRIALFITSLLGSSPGRIIMGFMCGTAFLSMWISNTATTMMMLPIGLAVISEITQTAPGKSGFAIALMLGIAYGASIGGIATPIGTPPNIVFLGIYDKSFPGAPQISFFKWITTFLPLTVILIPLVWFILIHVFGAYHGKSFSSRDLIREELKKLGPMSSAEKRVLAVFAITALLWIFRSDINLGFITIPGWSSIFAHPENFHDATVAVFMAIVLFFIPAGRKYPGRFLMDWSTAVRLPWGILLLFGGGFAIAGGFTSSGLSEQIGLALKPFLVFNPLLIIFIICVLLTFLTELTSNTATAAALLPIIGGTAIALNLNPLMLMIPATISASMAFMLPVATPPNAIVFSSGYIKMSQMAKVGLILNLAIAVIIACFVYFVALPFWGYDITVPSWVN